MKNIFTSKRAVYLRIAAACLFFAQSLVSYGQCPEFNGLSVPPAYLNTGFDGDGNFNAIVIGNYATGTGGTSGRLAVGGNFTLNSTGIYNVGNGLGVLADKDNFIVNGGLTNSTGGEIKVKGDFYYGSVIGLSNLPTHAAGQGGNINESGKIDFVGLKQHYINLSAQYASQASTPGTSVNITNGVLTLTGNNTVIDYVFNVTLPDGEISEVKFVNIPVGAGILINITNTIVNISTATALTPLMVTTYGDKTLFNFPNAEAVFISSFKMEGAFLGPKVDLSAVSGAINGPAVVGNNILLASEFVFTSTCFSYPLPVTLSGIQAKQEGMTGLLTWQTTSESNSEKFVIERNVVAKQWENIGEVAARGESDATLNYTFTDAAPVGGGNLYRLKMIDKDGSFAYSRIVNLNFKGSATAFAYPNPVTDQLAFNKEKINGVSSIQVLNHLGKPFFNKAIDGQNIIVNNWPAGLYILKYTKKDGTVHVQKIIKK
jgi:choice-of-anchor A domain-containing protein